MPSRLSYEPSVQAIVTDVLPPSTHLVAGKDRLRTRVSWPLLTRATGLGQIHGGEVVLVPAGRAGKVLANVRDLASTGVAAIVMADELTEAEEASLRDTGIPIAVVPRGTDVRRLQDDMEGYIIRRRRELFELTQEFHRSLVEAAIAGMGIQDLLKVAAAGTGKRAFLDQDGDVLQDQDDAAPLEQELLSRVRIASREEENACVRIPGSPPALVTPVAAGKERRGIVGFLGATESALDEDEVVLTTLASACAIALAREPVARPPTIEEALAGGLLAAQRSDGAPSTRGREASWIAMAVRDTGTTVLRLERALASELSSRDIRHVLARSGDVPVAVAQIDSGFRSETVTEAMQHRLASSQLEIGVSRLHRGVAGARTAVDEALEALRRSSGAGTTRFEAIELQVLLASIPVWEDFIQGRLGPLLDPGAGRRDLLQTLSVYLATGRNGTESARQLQLHRNTLLYRLRRIKELLEIDPDDPEDAFGLELALRIVKAHGDGLSAAGDTS